MSAGMGWYADPEDEAGERFWNGSMWGDQRRPRTENTREWPEPVAAQATSSSSSLSTIAGVCYLIAVVMGVGAVAGGAALITHSVPTACDQFGCSGATNPYRTVGLIAIAGGLIQALVVAFVGYVAAETGKVREALSARSAEVLDR